MKFIAISMLLAATQAVSLRNVPSEDLTLTMNDHACDYIEDNGEEIDTSLAVQLKDEEGPSKNQMIQDFVEKLGMSMTPEIEALADLSNEEISSKLVEVALEAGKTEDEISSVMGG